MRSVLILILLQFAHNSYSQQPVYLSTDSNNIYLANLTNCTYSLIGSTEVYMFDIAVTSDGRLWGVLADTLYQIDTISGSSSFVGRMDIQAGADLVDLNDSLLLTSTLGFLYSINVNDASTNLIGEIGFDPLGDLTWYENYLYQISNNGTLIKIELNDSNTEIISSVEMDYVPLAWAAITTSELSSINTLALFDGNQLYNVCPFDGSYDLICEILPNGESATGAASKRLPFQNPTPSNCLVLENQEMQSQKAISIYPNPILRDGVLTIDLGNDFNGTLSVQIKNDLGNIIQSTYLDFEKGVSNYQLQNIQYLSSVFMIQIITNTTIINSRLVIQ